MLLRLVVLLLCFSACKTSIDHNERIEILGSFDKLEELMDRHQDKTLVVNFWATTCPPCLKEMPLLNGLDQSSEDIKVLLVSMDESRHLASRVEPYVRKHDIKPEVVILGDENYSAWLDRVDSSWYGALPATLMLKEGQRNFRFGAYHNMLELTDDIDQLD